MNDLMKAYIDSFEQITVIMHKSIANYTKIFYLVSDEATNKLAINDCFDEGEFFKYILKNENKLNLNIDYKILDNDSNSTSLYIGSVVREELFDELYAYDGPLGVEYHHDYSIFRIWSPVAKEVSVILNNDRKESLSYIDKGLWEVMLDGNYELSSYYYLVRIFDETKKVNDPYAFASNSNHENYIIDFSKLYKKKYTPIYDDVKPKAVIYEASVRDLTSNLKSNNKGCYAGVVENNISKNGLPSGLDYLTFLGVTHLQLLPVFSFGGIDEIDKDEYYNWGYNPVEFFVPSGWYSAHPYSPYSRINELISLVDEANKRNIKVVMDVVFNHVFKQQTFPFDLLVPGYYYRHSNGWGTDASGCGNDLASEKYMCRRFIIDCLKYYTRVFGMSGFRFDLMGILDVDTINLAKTELLKINSNIMLYGEGWDMNTGVKQENKACMSNHDKMPDVGFFNDTFRDLIKGSQWHRGKGFAFGGTLDERMIHMLVTGSSYNNFLVSKPSDSINYVECHDNYTFYDFGKYVLHIDSKEIKEYSKLALQMILISNGIPFIHAGQEFCRTKQGVENSYMSSDKINGLPEKRKEQYKANILAIKDLIEIRKEYPLFISNDNDEIRKKITIDDELTDPHHIVIHHSYNDYELIIIIKNSEEVVNFEYACTMIYDSYNKCNQEKKIFTLKNIGVYIYKRRY